VQHVSWKSLKGLSKIYQENEKTTETMPVLVIAAGVTTKGYRI